MASGKKNIRTIYDTIFTDRNVNKAAHTVSPTHYIPSCYDVWSIRVDLE